MSYALRLLMRSYETFRPMRGYPTLDETSLLVRPDKHFKKESIVYFVESLEKINSPSVIVKDALDELKIILKSYK